MTILKESVLVIDLGNTDIGIGLFDGNKLGPHWRLATDQLRTADEYGLQLKGLLEPFNINRRKINGVCVSSVVPPLTQRLIEACQAYLGYDPLVVSAKLELGIKVLYEPPEAVGTDRLADAVAVYKKYGGPACVVDFGTATTLNAITDKGEYLGGAIMPGLGISADALVQRAAKLQPVELAAPPSPIGRNTIHAMQAGLIFGYVSSIEGLLEKFRHALGQEMCVIGTGGFIHVLGKLIPKIDHIDPWLTLDGLRLIWELNRGQYDKSTSG